jgi:hypothetical protein
MNVVILTPGFGDELFEKLSVKVRAIEESERDCVLLFHEMAIKK